LASRTEIVIIIADIAKVRLAELPVGLHARCHRLGQRDGDVGLVAFENLLGTELPSIGNVFPACGGTSAAKEMAVKTRGSPHVLAELLTTTARNQEASEDMNVDKPR
jgi:hypothetical protein